MEEQNLFKKRWNEICNYFVLYKISKKQIVSVLVGFIVAVFLVLLFAPTKNFPIGSVVEISPGESLQSITIKLHDQGIIRSEFIFRSLVILFGGEKKISAGDYLLTKRQGTFTLALRFINSQFGINTTRITIPEGWNIFQISDYLEKNLIQFDKKEFLALAKDKEGYLFPDTYFVSESIKPVDVLKMMENNFSKKIATIQKELSAFKYKQREVIIMASILEGEALPKDRSVVAGILWKRLEMNMPLQVDSTFSYINGKNTYELTPDDLKIDSPYNTYEHPGLPPGPINNPGLDSILSAIRPIKTNYLYFLTEKDGTIHYARTFEEHKKNKELYLR